MSFRIIMIKIPPQQLHAGNFWNEHPTFWILPKDELNWFKVFHRGFHAMSLTSHSSSSSQYIIQGGLPGRERLRVLAGILEPTTLSLLERVGIRTGMRCLDVGCGGGDVAFELARRVAPDGTVVGIDLDEQTLELARSEAALLGRHQASFQQAEVMSSDLPSEFDLVYARFLLTHLPDPVGALERMHDALRPGGVLIIEDIDFAGHFCWPPCPAFGRYQELYTQAVKLGGADPYIGPRLPGMLLDLGCREVQMHVIHPVGYDGDVKLMSAITMEKISTAVVAAGLATESEVQQIAADLYKVAGDRRTVMSMPRIIQAWGYRE
jgi:2-polyprenyl-3-methyl-5-hydroxy-6-metoxy-1,4-benzoquinol methylase